MASSRRSRVRNSFTSSATNAHKSIALAFEQNHLCFARVSRVVLPSARRAQRRGSSVATTPAGYFWGKAETVDVFNNKNPKSIWFNKTGARKTPLYLGPVTFRATDKPAVRRNAMLFGQVVSTPKGPKFAWWRCTGMSAFKYFVQNLPFKCRVARRSKYLYHSLSLDANSADADALYVLFRLLKFGDVSVVSKELLHGSAKERHAGRLKEEASATGGGYCVRHGYRLGMHPVEFLALACMLCSDAGYFCHAVPRMRKQGLLSDPEGRAMYARYHALLRPSCAFEVVQRRE
jgi:hypothetical protein